MLCAPAKTKETTENNTAHSVHYRMVSQVTSKQVIEFESGEVITFFLQIPKNNWISLSHIGN